MLDVSGLIEPPTISRCPRRGSIASSGRTGSSPGRSARTCAAGWREPVDGRTEFSGRLLEVSARSADPGRRRMGTRREIPRPAGDEGAAGSRGVRAGEGQDMMNKELIYVIEQIGRGEGDRAKRSSSRRWSLPSCRPPRRPWASPTTCGWRSTATPARSGSSRARRWSSAVTDPKLEIGLAEARKLNGEAELDDELEIELPPQEFGRIAAQTAKQVILQRVRDAERDAVYSEFIDKRGQDRPRHRAPHREAQRDRGARQGRGGHHRARADSRRALQPGRSRARLRAGGQEDGQGAADPALAHASRASWSRLFETEIPEIAEGIVLVKAAAREPGERAKVAVVVDQARRRSRSAPASACAARASR